MGKKNPKHNSNYRRKTQSSAKINKDTSGREYANYSESNLKQILKRNPSNFLSNFHMANYYMTNQQYQRSLKFCKKCVIMKPEDWQSWFLCGSAYYKMNKLKEAKNCFTKCSALNSGNAEVWTILGQINSILGDDESALDGYNNAKYLNPKNTDLPYSILESLMRQEKYDDAYNIAEDLHGSDPLDYETLNNIGHVELKRKNYDEAEMYLLKAHELRPSNGHLIYSIVRLYALMENKEKMQRFLKIGNKLFTDIDFFKQSYEKIKTNKNLKLTMSTNEI